MIMHTTHFERFCQRYGEDISYEEYLEMLREEAADQKLSMMREEGEL